MRTQLDEIQRIVYYWARYEGTRTPKGKEFSKVDINELISRLEKYKQNPEKFDWNSGEVIEQE